MNLPTIAHPEELLIFGAVALAALAGIYLLLRVTLAGARSLGRFVLPSKPFQRVLLPAARSLPYTEEAVSLACRLAGNGGGGKAAVVLSYMIEVPRSLAPDAPMPEAEAEAERVLAEAAETVRNCGLQAITQIRKSRAAVEEALRAIKEEHADLLVLMVPPNPADPNVPDPFVTLTTELARRATCEVILARPAA